MLQKIIEDIQRAQEYQEEYLRLRSLFKGANAHGSGALIKLVNSVFSWMFDWHRISLITIILMGIIIGLIQGF
jgi:hypothetical protein